MDEKILKKYPAISIIIPCVNEEKHIRECLESLIKQDYPKEKIEILVVDGMSKDKTRGIIRELQIQFPFINFLDNPKVFTPYGMNIGIKQARGDLIMIASAHSIYEKGCLSTYAQYFDNYQVDCVGGLQKTLSKEENLIAKAIILVLSSPFGVGNAYYRIAKETKPKIADTVPFPCYKKEVFDKIGLFNENLIRSQDLEFNLRLKRSGGKILLIPNIVAYYYPKSNFRDFFLNNFKSGIWVIYSSKFSGMPLRLRHYIPFIFILSLLGTLVLSIFLPLFFKLFLFIIILYFLAAIYFSTKIAHKEKDFRYLFFMPIVFANRHIGYGLGSILGVIKLFI